MSLKEFFKVVLSEDNNGHIHIDLDVLQKDEEGYFLTDPQFRASLAMLEAAKRTLEKNQLESLK